MSNGTETVLTPCSRDDSIIAAGNRVFARMIQTAAMAGVPGLRWKVSAASRLAASACSHARTAAA